MYVIYTSNSFFLVNISDIVVTIVHEMHRFTEAQEAAIILQFGELKHATLVRRWFLKEYPDIPHHQVPVALQFSRIRDRFLKTNSTRPGKPPGPKVSVATPEMVETVRGMILADQSISISEIALRLDCSYGTAWNILRKKLKVVFIENEIKITNFVSGLLQEPQDGDDLRQLPDQHHHAVEEERPGGTSLQRVRPLLQAPRGEKSDV